jgi:hypothetical protein
VRAGDAEAAADNGAPGDVTQTVEMARHAEENASRAEPR